MGKGGAFGAGSMFLARSVSGSYQKPSISQAPLPYEPSLIFPHMRWVHPLFAVQLSHLGQFTNERHALRRSEALGKERN